MQNFDLRKLIELISGIIETARKSILFLLTESSKEEEILMDEINELIKCFPESKICIEKSACEFYPNLLKEMEKDGLVLNGNKEIKRGVAKSDLIVGITMRPSIINKTSLGLEDDCITYAIMEALRQGKVILSSEDDFNIDLINSPRAYRKIFDDAKLRTETFGVKYCKMDALKNEIFLLDKFDESEKLVCFEKKEKKQVVTVADLMNQEDLIIAEDAIITPAAKEILAGKNKGEVRHDYWNSRW